VNDNANPERSDQFQPSVAAGPSGAVAIAFYDRRQSCPAPTLTADGGGPVYYQQQVLATVPRSALGL
jgi:hypothetical protein